MTEPIDAYIDQFQVSVGPYGCTINCMRSSAEPPSLSSFSRLECIATLRMSLEHLKAMTFLLHRQVVQYERDSATSVQMPVRVLNEMRIGPEDWKKFWE